VSEFFARGGDAHIATFLSDRWDVNVLSLTEIERLPCFAPYLAERTLPTTARLGRVNVGAVTSPRFPSPA
jgi:hypothetical protein